MNSITHKQEVYETNDYGIFKFSGNRPATTRPVLVKSIKEHGALVEMPLIVEKDTMRLLDGQHRLLAAMEAGKNVFFIYAQNECFKDSTFIAFINGLSKSWSTEDFIGFLCELENDSALWVTRTAKEYGISPYMLLCIAGMDNIQKSGIKKGILSIPEEKRQYVLLIAGRIKDWHFYLKSAVYNNTFAGAIKRVSSLKSYSHERMMARCKLVPGRIKVKNLTEDYLVMMEDIYNYGYGKNKVNLAWQAKNVRIANFED